RTVVAIKAGNGKRRVPFQVRDLFPDARGAFVPSGAHLGPAAEKIRKDQAPDKIPGKRVAAMGHRVGLDETRPANVPVAGADGNVMLEQRAGLGAAQTFAG